MHVATYHFESTTVDAVIVTIDGPSGSGKTTTAKRVARRLGYLYLDTGAMYRAVTLAFLRAGHDPASSSGAEEVLERLQIDLRYEDDEMHVSLQGEEVTDEIRSQKVDALVSDVASLRSVRERMVEEQRRIGREKEESQGGIVLDGRDTGTVVFPDADVKIFLVADLEERARRRLEQYRSQGTEATLEDMKRELRERDRKDETRDLAPLRQADDAVQFDSTNCTIGEQVQFVVDRVKAARDEGT